MKNICDIVWHWLTRKRRQRNLSRYHSMLRHPSMGYMA